MPTQNNKAVDYCLPPSAGLQNADLISIREISDLYHNAPCGYHSLDANGFIVRINNTELRWLGYQREEVIGKVKLADLLTPASRSTFGDLFSKFKEQGYIYDIEVELTRRDGTILHVLVNATAIYDTEGNFVMSRSTLCDISTRKQAEQKLRESEERFRSVMENAPIGIAVVSTKGRFVQVNQAFCNIVKYKNSEVVQLGFADLTYPEDLAANISYVHQLLNKQIPFFQMEKRYIRKDKEIIWVQITVSSIKDKTTGEVIYFIGHIEDITERKQTAQNLQKYADEIEDIYNNAPCGYHSLDANGTFLQINTTELQWLGYHREEVVRLMKFTDLLPPDGIHRFQANFQKFKEQGFMNNIEYDLVRKDGSTINVLMNVVAVKDVAGNFLRSRANVFDITEHKQIEKALRESEERFRNAMDNAPTGMAILSLDGQFIQVNNALCTILGYKSHELIKLTFQEITSLEDLNASLAIRQQILDGETSSFKVEKRYIRKNGEIVWAQVTGSSIRDSSTGKALYNIVQVENITERKQSQEKIRQLAYHDTLTNLPNRQLLLDRIGQALSHASRYKEHIAVMFLDLDKFKDINDTLGHDVGDELLKTIAVRLSAAVRSCDTVARPGGDEFIIILTKINDPNEAGVVAKKILETLAAPIYLRKHKLEITASIGITVYPVDGKNAFDLMKKADIAMYRAKDAGRNKYCFYMAEKSKYQLT